MITSWSTCYATFGHAKQILTRWVPAMVLLKIASLFVQLSLRFYMNWLSELGLLFSVVWSFKLFLSCLHPISLPPWSLWPHPPFWSFNAQTSLNFAIFIKSKTRKSSYYLAWRNNNKIKKSKSTEIENKKDLLLFGVIHSTRTQCCVRV